MSEAPRGFSFTIVSRGLRAEDGKAQEKVLDKLPHIIK
jgi:hypothetical protein